MKCIVIETSPERIAAKPVTNEDGTPHVYATIKEARAELKANGYSYNRANDRYYISGTEYRAYIVREDSADYEEIMTVAALNAAAESLINAYSEAIGDTITEDDPEHRAAYSVAREAMGYTTATEHDRETVELMTEAIARSAHRPDLTKYESMEYLEFDELEPERRELFQYCGLESFLGEYIDDFDVAAIIEEATEIDPRTGNRYWLDDIDLAAIAARHDLTTERHGLTA